MANQNHKSLFYLTQLFPDREILALEKKWTKNVASIVLYYITFIMGTFSNGTLMG